MVYDRLVHLSLSLWSCVIVMPWWRDSVQKGPVSNLWSLLFSWIQESALNVVVVHHSARISTNLGSVKRVGAFNIKSCGNWYLSVCLCCSYAYIAPSSWLIVVVALTNALQASSVVPSQRSFVTHDAQTSRDMFWIYINHNAVFTQLTTAVVL